MSPVRGDAWVPVVKPLCVVERPGAKRGGINRAVCNVSEALVSVVKGARLRVGQEGAEPVRAGRRPRKASLFQEWALRNPPAYRGAERANGRPGNSGEPSRPRRCGVAGSDARPITGEPGKWRWVVERQSERVVVLHAWPTGW